MHEIVCKMIMQQQYTLGHQDGAVASASASATGGGGPDPHFFGPLPPLPLQPPPLLPPPRATSSVHSALPLPTSMSMPRQMPVLLPFPPPPLPPPPPGSSNNRTRRPLRARKKNAVETCIAAPKSQTKNEITTRSFGVSLVPKEANRGILSDYNYLLTQQIELFEEISTTTNTSGANTKRTFIRIGLRCIHCSGSDCRAVGATFFPSATNFISPAFGNIGSRHLLGGKCPLLPAGIIEQLKAFKVTTQAQSKEEGRIGIDAYCRSLAAKSGIANHVSGGIYHARARNGVEEASSGAAPTGREIPEASVELPNEAKPAAKKKRKRSKSEKKAANNDMVPDLVSDSCTAAMDVDDDDKMPDEVITTSKSAPTEQPAMELEMMPLKDSADGNKENKPPTGSGTRSTGNNDETGLVPQQGRAKRFTYKPTGLDASSFVPGSVEYFWECKHCSSLPVSCRASGSVVFSAKPPSLEVVKGHLEKCQGLDALPIPRDAKISIGYGESLPPIRISFDNKQLKKRSKTIEMQRAALAAGKPWPPLCKDVGPFLPSGEVNPGVEKTRLAVKSDLTTEFAYTTVTLLRKCYLTKTGGSRGGQSIGFPGLACSFCAGRPNERRFFYTSADMLRNSFSHIPSHVMTCPYAPNEVRQNLESLKALRNTHKASLGPGSHKRFIAQVWKRMHSKNNGLNDGQEYMYDSASDDDDEIEEEVSTNRKDSANDDVPADAKMAAGGQGSNEVATVKRRRRQKAKPATSTDSEPGLASTRNGVAAAPSSRPGGSGGIKYIDTELVKVAERHLTTDLFYLSLQLGCEIYNLKPTDVERIGQSVVVGTPVIQCRFCNADSEQIGRIFMPRSAQTLRTMMLAIANHLSSSCPSCPQHIKSQLHMVGGQVREEQEGELKRGSALSHAEKVFTRLMAHDKSEKHEEDVVPLPAGASSVVLAGDEALLSGYTFYTLSQMAPCILDKSGQGSRSSFAVGTPGLACRHCSNSKNPRTFYYRNSEVFACNYSHIPSHLLTCPLVPANVKTLLTELKKQHATNKSKINKGSQRAFFGTVWRRLQIFSKDEKERQQQQLLQQQQQQQQVYDEGSTKMAAIPIDRQVAPVASPRTSSCGGCGSGEAGNQESAPVTTKVAVEE